jgi:hypothetical protein
LHSTICEEFSNHAQNNAWLEVVVEKELFLFSVPWQGVVILFVNR